MSTESGARLRDQRGVPVRRGCHGLRGAGRIESGLGEHREEMPFAVLKRSDQSTADEIGHKAEQQGGLNDATRPRLVRGASVGP